MIWRSGDGTGWQYDARRRRWSGTVPGLPEEPLERTVADFRYAYPEAPHWDGWFRRMMALGPQRLIRDRKFQPRTGRRTW
jgi:hypothetical protein